MGALEVRGLRKKYGKTTAIQNLDLSIGNGEFFVVLGPSGAGKTTTLKSVAGLVDIDEGTVEIAGRDVTDTEPYHRNVAMAFESYALYPQKSVFDNLASPLKSGRSGKFTVDDQRRRIEAVTTTLGIAHLLQRLPRELSNGQRQRVALGRVLVRPADIYLLDEPLSHLDAKLRAAMRAELKQLGEMSDTTTLYVTHDYQEALALGDRVAVLREGEVVQIGTPEEVWKQPVDTFVARALGQPEINLLGAEVDQGRVRTIGGALDVAVPDGLSVEAGQSLRIGIRPRDIEVLRGGPGDDDLYLSGRVELAERLGRLVEMSVDVGNRTSVIVVTSSDRAAHEGDRVELAVPYDSVHIFDGGPAGTDTARLGSAKTRASLG